MLSPVFRKDIVQSKREDGYWLETFKLDPNDVAPGLIAYGLDTGIVEFLDNPLNTRTSCYSPDWVVLSKTAQLQSSSEGSVKRYLKVSNAPIAEMIKSTNETIDWEATKIAQLDSPVAVAVADVDNDGLNDLIMCYNYGKDFINCDPKGGYIAWLKNPGRAKLGHDVWNLHYIGRWPAMHRLKAGYFTQRTILELIALPVVHGPRDLSTPIPIFLFQAPADVLKALSWSRSVIDDSSFTIIHDACKGRFTSSGDIGLESLILASREGLTWLHFTESGWKKELLNVGMPIAPGQTPQKEDFWGCESVDVGRFGGDSYAYIATLEAFHGTTVAVYIKQPLGLGHVAWKRYVLDIYGTPTQQSKQGSGPAHFVVTADFDNDGNDEFVVALWGPSPEEPGPVSSAIECQGVWYYKPVDLSNGTFAKWKVASESAARIATGDFCGDGRLSFATISYFVANYYKSPDPQVRVYYNDFAQSGKHVAAPLFRTAYRNNEALVCLPKPSSTEHLKILPLIGLAEFRLELEILPPRGKRAEDESADAIKVLYGSVLVDGQNIPKEALSVPDYSSASAAIGHCGYRALEQGAVLLRLIRVAADKATWPDVHSIPLKPLLTVSPPDGPQPDWQFRRVKEDKDFWNLIGFDIRFSDQTPLAHVQFWAAGPETDCGLHCHNDAIFGEVHLSLSTGTGNGGIWWLPTPPTVDEFEFKIPTHQASDFTRLPLKKLMEHGPIWYHEKTSGKTLRRTDSTVCYPWHKWQAGNEGTHMDVWMAVEFSPQLLP